MDLAKLATQIPKLKLPLHLAAFAVVVVAFVALRVVGPGDIAALVAFGVVLVASVTLVVFMHVPNFFPRNHRAAVFLGALIICLGSLIWLATLAVRSIDSVEDPRVAQLREMGDYTRRLALQFGERAHLGPASDDLQTRVCDLHARAQDVASDGLGAEWRIQHLALLAGSAVMCATLVSERGESNELAVRMAHRAVAASELGLATIDALRNRSRQGRRPLDAAAVNWLDRSRKETVLRYYAALGAAVLWQKSGASDWLARARRHWHAIDVADRLQNPATEPVLVSALSDEQGGTSKLAGPGDGDLD